MNSYFAKYLPVGGEIKPCDKIITVTGYLKDYNPETDLLSEYEAPTKVKLFLCSHDIQPGDKVEVLPNTQAAFHDEPIVTENTIKLLNERPYLKNYIFKVIGEISSDAIWVKEWDEFDEDDIKRDILIKDSFGGCYEHLHPKGLESIEKLSDTETIITEYPITIKCPTCKNFH